MTKMSTWSKRGTKEFLSVANLHFVECLTQAVRRDSSTKPHKGPGAGLTCPDVEGSNRNRLWQLRRRDRHTTRHPRTTKDQQR